MTDSATASAEEKNYNLTRVATAFVRKCVTNVSHWPWVITGRKRSWAKVMFLQASVILLTEGLSASVHAGIPTPPGSRHPPRADPREQTPPWSRHHPEADIPWEQTPPGADTHREQTPPRSRHPPGADTPWEQTPPPGLSMFFHACYLFVCNSEIIVGF